MLNNCTNDKENWKSGNCWDCDWKFLHAKLSLQKIKLGGFWDRTHILGWGLSALIDSLL